MVKREKTIMETIATLKILKGNFEKEAMPRKPLRALRYSLSIAIALLEKQIRKEPLKEEDSDGWVIRYYCPCCKRYLGQRGKRSVIIFHKENYCQREGCGQALDWEKESEV